MLEQLEKINIKFKIYQGNSISNIQINMATLKHNKELNIETKIYDIQELILRTIIFALKNIFKPNFLIDIHIKFPNIITEIENGYLIKNYQKNLYKTTPKYFKLWNELYSLIEKHSFKVSFIPQK